MGRQRATALHGEPTYRVMTKAARLATFLAEGRHYESLVDVLDRLPAGPITLNHLGLPFPDVDREAWRRLMRAFAQRPQSFVQLSGLPFLFGDQ